MGPPERRRPPKSLDRPPRNPGPWKSTRHYSWAPWRQPFCSQPARRTGRTCGLSGSTLLRCAAPMEHRA
eukprot:534470-Pyramimonas_sp.AAC.1